MGFKDTAGIGRAQGLYRQKQKDAYARFAI